MSSETTAKKFGNMMMLEREEEEEERERERERVETTTISGYRGLIYQLMITTTHIYITTARRLLSFFFFFKHVSLQDHAQCIISCKKISFRKFKKKHSKNDVWNHGLHLHVQEQQGGHTLKTRKVHGENEKYGECSEHESGTSQG